MGAGLADAAPRRVPRSVQRVASARDFRRLDPSLRRIVVLGGTGAGKSTLLNVCAAWRFVQSKENPHAPHKWVAPAGCHDASPPFTAAGSVASVTQATSGARIHFRGDPDRAVYVVDTPGFDDTCENDADRFNSEASATDEGVKARDLREKIHAMKKEMLDRLKALGHVDAILLVHPDVISNRLNPVFIIQLKMLDECFGEDVWKHVVVAYTKHCNPYETTWRSQLLEKKIMLRDAIKTCTRCTVDVPVVALGASEPDDRPPGEAKHKLDEQYEALWDHMTATARAEGPLRTAQLKEPEGEWVQVDEYIFETARADGTLLWKAAKLGAMGIGVGTLVAASSVAPLPALLVNPEVLIVGSSYLLKARSVGGHRELRRQLHEQLRLWKEYATDEDARKLTHGAAMVGVEGAVGGAAALVRRAIGRGAAARAV